MIFLVQCSNLTKFVLKQQNQITKCTIKPYPKTTYYDIGQVDFDLIWNALRIKCKDWT